MIPHTEQRNEKSRHIDKMTSLEMVKVMNDENRNSVDAVERVLPSVAKAVDIVAEAIANGGRVLYVGAGTSGRLGIIDATECPPTFGADPSTFRGIIAGGKERVFTAAEGEEDSYEAGVNDVKDVLCSRDVAIGISAAGNAAYVLGALSKAREIGCRTISIVNNAGCKLESAADLCICCDTGAEVITGSTRLKAGNSQKFILNMISTCSMIKTGKVYENLMINLRPTNIKLRARCIRITSEILGTDEETAEKLLEKHSFNIRETVESEKR